MKKKIMLFALAQKSIGERIGVFLYFVLFFGMGR